MSKTGDICADSFEIYVSGNTIKEQPETDRTGGRLKN